MENRSPLALIKAGFFLGLGFVIPLLLVEYVAVRFAVTEMISASEEYMEELDENMFSADETDVAVLPELGEYEANMQGEQLLITGTVKNISDRPYESITLEAELYDEAGKFVYECTEYINQELAVGQSENYLIKCGCSKGDVPDFASAKVKVTDVY